MIPVTEKVKQCAGLVPLEPGQVQLLDASGEPPPWTIAKPELEVGLQRLGACADPRGAFSVRFDTDAQGRTHGVKVGALQRNASECVAAQLATVDLHARYAHAYTLTLWAHAPVFQRAVPAPADAGMPEWRKRQSAQIEAANAQEAAREAAKLHDHSKDPPRLPPELDENRVAELRAALREAHRQCKDLDFQGCARTIHPVRQSFAQLPLSSDYGARPIAPYMLNTLLEGFDCLSVDTPSYKTNTAVIVGRAQPQPSWWSLRSNTDASGFSWSLHATNEPWPAGYHGRGASFLNLPAEPLSICFEFEKPTTEIVYVGVATYPGSESSKQSNSTELDMLAVGLMPVGREASMLCDDLKSGRVDAVTEKLAARVDINSTEALVCALYGSWPIDKLDILLRAGADPNVIPVGTEEGPLYYALQRAHRDGDAKVAGAVRQLLKAGANPNFADIAGRTLMHYAADPRYPLTWKAMIDGGGNRNQPDDEGITPARRYETSPH